VSVPRPHLQVTYADLLTVVHLLHDFPAPWYVSGGWALDALVGRATRPHEDVEIGIARQDQGYLHRHLATWQLYKVVHNTSRNDADLLPWEPAERLELPVHQIVAQCPGATPPEFEFFLNEVWENEWQFRKERSIRRPLTASYLQTAQGIPVLAPELQLLYKATLHRPKDEHDFQTALGSLGPDQRAWLKQALESFRPGDPWLDALT
jgi:hypothetical protein